MSNVTSKYGHDITDEYGRKLRYITDDETYSNLLERETEAWKKRDWKQAALLLGMMSDRANELGCEGTAAYLAWESRFVQGVTSREEDDKYKGFAPRGIPKGLASIHGVTTKGEGAASE